MLNIATIIESSAREYPQKTALVLGDNRISYAALNAAANQVANGLAERGIGAGDKVALSCPNLPYFPIVYYGIVKTGAAAVPLNVLLKHREIAYILADSEAKAYFCFAGTPDLPLGEEGWKAFNEVAGCRDFFLITAAPAAPSSIAGAATLGSLMAGKPPAFDTCQMGPDDVCMIPYTSGTTGNPKGAELTHSNIVMNSMISKDLSRTTADDILLVTLPMFHIYAQVVQMHAGLLAGSTLVLVPRFDPDAVLTLMEKEAVTMFAGVPTMYWALVNHPRLGDYDLKKIAQNLRVGASGGASIPVELIRDFESKFDVPIIEGYGLTETSPVVTFNHLHRERKPGSVGTPIWGVEVKVVDQDDNEVSRGAEGEVVCRGHCVLKGYYNNPQATEEALRGGWFHTGDIGKMDDDGYLYIVDRVKDMIIRGGYNVYPREIEEVLMTHPAVSLAAVIGVPDAEHGEEIKAYIIRNQGANLTEDELVAWCRDQIAAYKYPRIIAFKDNLPMTATGKILKKELRAG